MCHVPTIFMVHNVTSPTINSSTFSSSILFLLSFSPTSLSLSLFLHLLPSSLLPLLSSLLSSLFSLPSSLLPLLSSLFSSLFSPPSPLFSLLSSLLPLLVFLPLTSCLSFPSFSLFLSLSSPLFPPILLPPPSSSHPPLTLLSPSSHPSVLPLPHTSLIEQYQLPSPGVSEERSSRLELGYREPKHMDPGKARQAERLGMGVGRIG